jgi:dihydropteroate synthase
VILMASEHAASTADPITVILALLRQGLQRARDAGVARDRIVVDPGIGFFRRTRAPWHTVDCIVLAQLSRLRRLGRPVLVGLSRKSFIGKLTGRDRPEDRLHGSLGATALAVYNGAALVRAHDVAPTLDTIRVAEAIRQEIGSIASTGRPRARHAPKPARRTRQGLLPAPR